MSNNQSTAENINNSKQLPKLEYLPAYRQKQLEQENLNKYNLKPDVIEAKKQSGYLQEPTSFPKQHAEHGRDYPAEMVGYYDEINERKSKTWEKLTNIGKYNPFVPLGCLITIGVLANGVWAMKKKDANKSQRMMRYRIAAQGSTIIALVLGTMASQYFASIEEKSKSSK